MVEVGLQVAVVAGTYFLEALLAECVLFPFGSGTFVAAEVDVAEGENVGELVNDIFRKLYGFGICHIDDVGRNALREPHFVGAVGVATEKFGIGSHCGLGVAGDVHFGHNLHEAVAGVGHNFACIVLRVVAAVAQSVGLDVAPSEHLALAPCADGGETGIFLYFEAPALVFGEVPVEAVHLVARHDVDDFLHFVLTVEVSAFVEHEAAPGETRCVADVYGG